MKKIIWVIDQVLRKIRLDWIKAILPKKGYLYATGWIKSTISKKPIDRNRNPIPWLTYPAVSYLETRIRSNFDVFEYGSGNSTIWFSQRVNSVTTIEHDPDWWPTIQKEIDPIENVSAGFIDHQTDAYLQAVRSPEKKYDLIIIDGRSRVETCKAAILSLKENGVIVFDNTERKYYQPAFDYLDTEGFKRLDFWGLAAGNPFETCTSIFYRSANCLNI